MFFLCLEHTKGYFIVGWYIFTISVTGSIDLEESGSTFSEWTSRRTWKDRQKAKKANATGSQHLLASSEPELIYYGKHSGLVGLRKSDVLCPAVNDAACTSSYDKVLYCNLIASLVWVILHITGCYWIYVIILWLQLMDYNMIWSGNRLWFSSTQINIFICWREKYLLW